MYKDKDFVFLFFLFFSFIWKRRGKSRRLATRNLGPLEESVSFQFLNDPLATDSFRNIEFIDVPLSLIESTSLRLRKRNQRTTPRPRGSLSQDRIRTRRLKTRSSDRVATWSVWRVNEGREAQVPSSTSIVTSRRGKKRRRRRRRKWEERREKVRRKRRAVRLNREEQWGASSSEGRRGWTWELVVLEISNVTASPHGRLTHGVRLGLAPSASWANYRGVSFPARRVGQPPGKRRGGEEKAAIDRKSRPRKEEFERGGKREEEEEEERIETSRRKWKMPLRPLVRVLFCRNRAEFHLNVSL